ncbi:MAG: GreA/GreB family elongation factor [Planctomycetota bacterium]
MTAISLVDLALENRVEELELAWSKTLEESGDIAPYCKALDVLCERDMASRALTLAESAIEALVGRDRQQDAFEVGMTLIRRDAHHDQLATRLFALLSDRFGTESWYETIAELAELTEANITAASLESFETMRRYTKGHVVYHRAGWGEGLVEQFDAARRELRIQFNSGATQEVPLTTAIDSMTPLAEDDYRAMLLTQKAELERLAAEDPSVLIRKVAKIYRGRVSSSEFKSNLTPALIPTKKWASFWKKAKTAAAADPWLQVEGSTTRPIFVLRKRPLSLRDETVRRVKHCDDLGQEVALIREYLDRTSDAEAQQSILDIAQERIEAAARAGNAAHAHVLDGILLLEGFERHPSTSAATELRAMLYADGEFKPEAFSLLASQDAREHAVRLLPEALGEGWDQHCVGNLLQFPATVVEPVVQLLADKSKAAALVSLWVQIAPYPQRHPVTTYLLGRLYADGTFDEVEGKPERVAVARVLLHLARVLSGERKRVQSLARLLTRLTSLLAGRRKFLNTILEDLDRDSLASFLGICERGGQEFPTEISDLVLKVVARKHPDLTAKPEKPFWDNDDAIYVTRAGLDTKREEYRRLVDDLIPANSRAIGAAAELGDLSENSEWEAAMEEQRNLTGRASMMDEDLRKAKLIEEVELVENVAAPGTRVTFTHVDTGEQRTLSILGPWDTTSEDIINYRAPAASPLLGKSPGDTAKLPSEHGPIVVRVDAVELLR